MGKRKLKLNKKHPILVQFNVREMAKDADLPKYFKSVQFKRKSERQMKKVNVGRAIKNLLESIKEMGKKKNKRKNDEEKTVK